MWGSAGGVDLVQPQLDALELRVSIARLDEQIKALDRVTDEKFVRLGVVVAAEAERVRLALDATQKAIDKAEKATEKSAEALAVDVKSRFEHVNELRGALSDSQANNVSRQEFDQFRSTYAEQHILLRDQHAKEISDLKGRLDRAEGKSTGTASLWAGVVGGVTLIVIIVNVVIYALSNS